MYAIRRYGLRRLAAVAAAASVLIVVAGCAGDDTRTTARPSPSVHAFLEKAPAPAAKPAPLAAGRPPAAAAGGACKLLNYGTVAVSTGTDFQVAAAGGSDGTQSCVLQVLYTPYPDLRLSLADTKADAKVYAKTVVPDGAATVAGLGKSGYRVVRGADSGTGPIAEVGWLGAGPRLAVLRYTTPRYTSAAEANRLATQLVALAKKIESAR